MLAPNKCKLAMQGRARYSKHGTETLPMLSSLHAYMASSLPVVMHFLGCADEIPKPVKKKLQ